MKTPPLILALAFVLIPSAHAGDSHVSPRGDDSNDASLPEKQSPPNIILIMADDLGWETLGAYGNERYKTPRLDQLAREGVTFNHAYCTPLCTPTRVMLMTGKYGHRNYRVFGQFPKEDEEKTIGNLMRKAGYATCMAGKWHVKGVTAGKMGFDRALRCEAWGGYWSRNPVWVDDKKLSKEETGALLDQHPYRPDLTNAFVTRFIEEHKDRPFFVYYPMFLVHHPEVPSPAYPDKGAIHKVRAEEAGDGGRYRESRGPESEAIFDDMVGYMDTLVGRIIDKLERLDLRENTLIIFTGDNGTCLHRSKIGDRMAGGGKGSMKDRGTRVPLVVSWKGRSPAGMVLDDLVDFTDFLPTLAAAAGVEEPGEWTGDGVSFLPQTIGEKGTPRDWAFMHYKGRDSGNWPVTAGAYWARDQRWKLYHDKRLFDLAADPDESSPIASTEDDAASAAARRHLSAVFRGLKVSPATLVSKEAEQADRLRRNEEKSRASSR